MNECGVACLTLMKGGEAHGELAGPETAFDMARDVVHENLPNEQLGRVDEDEGLDGDAPELGHREE